MDLILLSGPPFGPGLFEQVQKRLGRGRCEAVLPTPSGGARFEDAVARLSEALAAGPTVLVAHGLAVPVAVAAASRTPPSALVLSNGPIRHVDPVTRALVHAASRPGLRTALGAALRPGAWIPALASSAALRRLVVNPYVMDRDTVVALCGPLVAGAADRAALLAWLASMGPLPESRSIRCPTLLLWGDADPLYPLEEAAFAESVLADAEHVSVPGGQHLHPVERPWEMADRLQDWLQRRGLAAQG